MSSEALILVPRFIDRGGKTVYTMYPHSNKALSSIVRDDSALGDIRFPLGDAETEEHTDARIDWAGPDLVDQMEEKK